MREFHSSEHKIRINGPDEGNQTREKERQDAGHPTGWCIGDIDFDDDGSIFIRNPYLANAIERKLEEKFQKYDPTVDGSFVFRLTRDEGFSGPKVNIVC